MNAPHLKVKARQEPEPPRVPIMKPIEVRETTAKFLDGIDMMQEQNQYLRAENDELTRELRIAIERIRLIETELHDVRNVRDHMQRRCASMLTLLSSVKLLIVDGEEKWRAEAFAPIGSVPKPNVDHAEVVEELAKALNIPPEET